VNAAATVRGRAPQPAIIGNAMLKQEKASHEIRRQNWPFCAVRLWRIRYREVAQYSAIRAGGREFLPALPALQARVDRLPGDRV